jgi:hypothetical protein
MGFNVTVTPIVQEVEISATVQPYEVQVTANQDLVDYVNEAKQSADEAEASAILADNSADNALASATSATASASSASASASSASSSASTATTQAGIATTKANEASQSASNALASEQASAISEGNALASEQASAQSEANALQSEQNALASEQASALSASNALASENSASASASTATSQAGIATTQAGIATTQAGNALISANNAAASAAAAAQTGTSTLLTGFSVGANTSILATDSILQAFNKTQGQINARISGTIATGQVAFGTGVNTIGGDSGLTWDNVNKRLIAGGSSSAFRISSQDTNSNIYSTTTALSAQFQVLNNSVGTSRSAGIFFSTISGDTNNSTFIIGSVSPATGNTPAFVFQQRTGAATWAERFRIHTSGNIGVQTDSPTSTLDVNGTGRIRNGVSLADTSGNVQIGTTTDAGFRLDVNGTARVQGNLNVSTGGITLTGAQTIQTSTGNLTIATAGGNGTVIISPNGTGRVGIDNPNPLTNIHLGGVSTLLPEQTYANSGESSGLGINTYTLNTGNFNRYVDLVAFSETMVGPRPSCVRIFVQREVASQSPTEFLRIQPVLGGNSRLGILTTAPTQSLDVNGTGRIRNGVSLADVSGNVQIGTTTDAGFRLDVNGTARFSNNVTIADTCNIILATGTGTKIGTATSQKLSLWNATPNVQPTNAIVASAFVANTSGIANDTATFGGYTIGQIVAALQRLGALA